MKLLLKRFRFLENTTIGRLYVDDEFFCYTCEDKDRGLKTSMSLVDIKKIKVKDETCIPYTDKVFYPITLKEQSPKYSNFEKYKWARFCNGYLPRVQNVPGYDGVLIHVGNTNKDTSGCILVGDCITTNGVGSSTVCFKRLYEKLKEAKDAITIQIEKEK